MSEGGAFCSSSRVQGWHTDTQMSSSISWSAAFPRCSISSAVAAVKVAVPSSTSHGALKNASAGIVLKSTLALGQHSSRLVSCMEGWHASSSTLAAMPLTSSRTRLVRSSSESRRIEQYSVKLQRSESGERRQRRPPEGRCPAGDLQLLQAANACQLLKPFKARRIPLMGVRGGGVHPEVAKRAGPGVCNAAGPALELLPSLQASVCR